MHLYSIEDKEGLRKYFVARNSHEFTQMVISEISKEKNILRKQAKAKLKDYFLVKYEPTNSIPFFNIDTKVHSDILAKSLIDMYNEGYVGYALICQYYYE